MIVLRTPKGWTGPKEVDGQPAEGTFRSHQVPLANLSENPEHLPQLERWLRSYRPEELFDEDGRLREELRALRPVARAPDGRQPARERRPACCATSSCPTSGTTRSPSSARPRPLARRHGCSAPGCATSCGQSRFVANFRVFGPDETASNRLGAALRRDRPRLDGRPPRRATTTCRPTGE